MIQFFTKFIFKQKFYIEDYIYSKNWYFGLQPFQNDDITRFLEEFKDLKNGLNKQTLKLAGNEIWFRYIKH